MTRLVMTAATAALLGLMTTLTGCGGKSMWRGNVEVGLDQALVAQEPSITVHMIAPSKTEESIWSSVNVRDYWAPGNTLREGAKDRIKEFRFGPGDTKSKTLSSSDPIWSKWAGAEKLFIIGNLPDAVAVARGDPSRTEIPLSAEWWKNVEAIKVKVMKGHMHVETPMTPPK